MDTKNVIAAISLSAAVIILYSLFWAPPPPDPKLVQTEKNKVTQNNSTEAPSLEQNDETVKISRDEALEEGKRILFENENIKGSISLTGSRIDDLEFKKFKETLNGEDNVVLLNPSKVKSGYYVETGWATTNKNIDIPNSVSTWEIEGNNRLTPNTPVKLFWLNDQNIKFEKEISIDDQYLFTVKQTIVNNSEKTYNFYPYGQIIRNEIPEITNFFILHEGALGVFNSELVEEDYDDIQDKPFSINADNGWLGITDKYWITTIIPKENRKFRADFDYKNNRFRTSYIESNATEIGANETKSNEIKVLLAAKEVRIIDEYAKKLNIEKLDLVIDWGYLYFLTRPMWFALDYFFKLLGNYGLAIIAVTVCIRVILFPLAQMSFVSMGRMKKLQPEMTRLKSIHKDKADLQRAMMALYKREKVNPMSGCLPIVPMIFIFFSLYKVLFVTVDSRHEPFFGWIQDLSSRDPTSFANLFGLIPWDPPTFLLIGIWPIAMGISMYVQQLLNPQMPDPVQRKIFQFFPLVLTIILAPFPAGLVIYWTVNNILQMGQQYLVLRSTKVKTT